MNRMFQITAKQLIKFNEAAHKEKQNRVLNIEDKYSKPDTMPLKVDESKLCLCQPIIVHTNCHGVQSWRCLVVFGVVGQTNPETSLLDLPLRFRREVLKKPVEEDGSIGQPRTELSLMGGWYSDPKAEGDSDSDSDKSASSE